MQELNQPRVAFDLSRSARVEDHFRKSWDEEQRRQTAAGLMTVVRLPYFYAGLIVWHITEDGETAVYRHPTKKATLGRFRILRIGDVIAMRDYGRRSGAR